MIQPGWDVLHQHNVAGIEVQLRRYDLPRPAEFHVREPRPILSLMLNSYSARRKGRYAGIGSDFQGLGDIVMTPAHVDCQFRGDGGQPLVLSCLFDGKLFDQVTRLDGDWSKQQLLATFDLDGRTGRSLDFLLRRLAQELSMPGFAIDTLIEGIGLTALAELSRHLGGRNPAPASGRGGLTDLQMRQIETCITDMPGIAPTISLLAQQCGLGPRRFTTLFRLTTGRSVHEWVEERRMDSARRLLATTSHPLKRIAFDLGFASHAVFCMAFRRHSGMTPSTYRAMARGK